MGSRGRRQLVHQRQHYRRTKRGLQHWMLSWSQRDSDVLEYDSAAGIRRQMV
jgi:hypothetical protein